MPANTSIPPCLPGRERREERGGTMKRIALLTATLLMFTLAISSCKKKEPPPPPPPTPGQGMPGQGMPGQPGAMPPMGGGPEKKILVPDAVKGSWKAVKVEVEYKEKKS